MTYVCDDRNNRGFCLYEALDLKGTETDRQLVTTAVEVLKGAIGAAALAALLYNNKELQRRHAEGDLVSVTWALALAGEFAIRTHKGHPKEALDVLNRIFMQAVRVIKADTNVDLQIVMVEKTKEKETV